MEKSYNLQPKPEIEPVKVEQKDPEAEYQEEEIKEKPEVIIQPDEYDVSLAACFSLTMVNGHIVKFLPNGDVMQKKIKSKLQNLLEAHVGSPDEELHRVVTGKGIFLAIF